MAYTDVFGGTTIYPSDVSYLALDLTADEVLQWPLEATVGDNLVARIIDVSCTGNYDLTMPDATETSPGQTILFNGLGSGTTTVVDADGGTLLSLPPGQQWQIYLTDTTTTAGTWRVFRYGAATAQAQASALAGFGLVATGSTLSQSTPVLTFNTDYSAGAPDRAGAYVWTGGVGSYTLPSASTVGDNWFVSLRNSGSGDLTAYPAGAETIDGSATKVFQPGDSASFVTDGIDWFSIGFGQSSIFAFDYTVIDLTGQSSPYTLSGSQLNRIAYKFVGTLAADMNVVVPGTIQQYWVTNATTGGSYLMNIGVSGQVPFVNVPRGARGIYYSNGTEVVNADTNAISYPISIANGGTGATTAGAALINFGGTSYGIGVFTASSAANARNSILAASQGANTFTAEQTFSGSTANMAAKLVNAAEAVTVSATAATGTINYDVTTQSVLYYTTNASGDWVLNIRGSSSTTLDSVLGVGESTTIAFLAAIGPSQHFNTAVTVDGTSSGVTVVWQNGIPLAGLASSLAVYSYVIIKTGSATFTVLGSLAAFY